jgi:RHS repeat-associated protein
MENDDEIKGEGNSYDFGARIHDPRLGRFFSIDPKWRQFADFSPYSYAANNPNYFIDNDGENPIVFLFRKFFTSKSAAHKFVDQKGLKGEQRTRTLQFIGRLDTVLGEFDDIEQALDAMRQVREFFQDPPTLETACQSCDEYTNMDAFTVIPAVDQAMQVVDIIENWDDIDAYTQGQILGEIEIAAAEAGATAIVGRGIGSGGMTARSLKQRFPEVRLKAAKSKTPVNNLKGGAARAAQYSESWGNGSLQAAINKFAAGSKGVKTSTGKTIYKNNNTGIQVVVDNDGNYFRIEDTNLTGRRRYLDLDGNLPNNKTVNGKTSGRSQSQYNEVTHFNNTDKE